MIHHSRFFTHAVLLSLWMLSPGTDSMADEGQSTPTVNAPASADQPCTADDAHPAIEHVLRLPPREENPRNSEGDFIQLADERLLFIYTHFMGGSGDHSSARLVSRVSQDAGATWSAEDQLVLQNEGGWNVMSVSLLRLDDGRIAMFYMRKNSLDDCRPFVRFSSDETETWSEPVEIIGQDQIGYYVLNNDRVVQLDDGRLIVPVALHNHPGWQKPDWRGEITCYLSDDTGKSWHRSRTQQTAHTPAGKRIMAQEPGVVELTDGRLMMWVRTDAGQQYQAFSTDRGETWSAFEPMPLASPRSPASIERIPLTGDLLAVWNNHAHRKPANRTARTPLSLAISRDEGTTWTRSKNLADDPQGWYCYTAIEFIGEHVLLGHIAGNQAGGQRLATTELIRFPLQWYYGTLGIENAVQQAPAADAGHEELQQDWQWDRGVPEDRRWEDGMLQVKTQPGRIWGGDGNRNLLVTKQPIGRGGEAIADIELLNAVGKFEQCGLLVYVHDDRFVKLVVEHIDGDHYVVMAWEKNGRGQVIAKTKISKPRAQLQLRVSDDQVEGFWRLAEDESWQAAASCEFGSQQPRKFALFSQDGEPNQRRWAVVRKLSWQPQDGDPSKVAPSSAD